MKPAYDHQGAQVHLGDCVDVMRGMDADSFHAVVCDPPYALTFMGREWDTYGALDFEVWCKEWATEALRVTRPGGHLIAFGATRTHHRLMAGIEDAGWEVRDCGVHLYRSGFPKSLDVSKAIDRAAGAKREVVSFDPSKARPNKESYAKVPAHMAQAGTGGLTGVQDNGATATAPATDAARQWQGWGTALKPAIEMWVLARKPLSERTVAANVQRWGCGGLNVDGCRAPAEGGDEPKRWSSPRGGIWRTDSEAEGVLETSDLGRWPANALTLEPDPELRHFRAAGGQIADYPKAGSAEKPWGGSSSAAILPKTRQCNVCGSRAKAAGSEHGRSWPTCGHEDWSWVVPQTSVDSELHPTVKPLALMRHLVRLVTPPGGSVLDPFAGTGTTLEAALIEGFTAVGIEREAGYLELIKRRLSKPIETTLFGGAA